MQISISIDAITEELDERCFMEESLNEVAL